MAGKCERKAICTKKSRKKTLDKMETYLEHEDWEQQWAQAKQPDLVPELHEKGQIAKLCLVPVFQGGPDPPEKDAEYDPEIHWRPQEQSNPWEICAQLHAGEALQKLVTEGKEKYCFSRVGVGAPPRARRRDNEETVAKT